MSTKIFKSRDNEGVKSNECPQCGQTNAHLKMATGWMCLGCRNLIKWETINEIQKPPIEEEYIVIPWEIDGTIVVVV